MATNHVSVRLDEGTMARVDALAPMFSTKWRPATRSDILRGLILSALERYEHEQEPTRSRGDQPGRAAASAPARPRRTPPEKPSLPKGRR